MTCTNDHVPDTGHAGSDRDPGRCTYLERTGYEEWTATVTNGPGELTEPPNSALVIPVQARSFADALDHLKSKSIDPGLVTVRQYEPPRGTDVETFVYSRETSQIVGAAILSIAGESRTPDSIWKDPTPAERHHVQMAVEEFHRSGLYDHDPDEPVYHWGLEEVFIPPYVSIAREFLHNHGLDQGNNPLDIHMLQAVGKLENDPDNIRVSNDGCFRWQFEDGSAVVATHDTIGLGIHRDELDSAREIAERTPEITEDPLFHVLGPDSAYLFGPQHLGAIPPTKFERHLALEPDFLKDRGRDMDLER